MGNVLGFEKKEGHTVYLVRRPSGEPCGQLKYDKASRTWYFWPFSSESFSPGYLEQIRKKQLELR